MMSTRYILYNNERSFKGKYPKEEGFGENNLSEQTTTRWKEILIESKEET